jgi:uncharacterized MAPEG superfamily protein
VNVPYLCVLLAFLSIYFPKIPLSVAMARAPGGYDNAHPREQQAKLEGWGKRAAAAHANGFEAFPGFAAGVVLAILAHADPWWTNTLCVAFVVARYVYPFLYMANVDKLRSAVWGVGFSATLGLFLLALRA